MNFIKVYDYEMPDGRLALLRTQATTRLHDR